MGLEGPRYGDQPLARALEGPKLVENACGKERTRMACRHLATEQVVRRDGIVIERALSPGALRHYPTSVRKTKVTLPAAFVAVRQGVCAYSQG